MKKPDTELLQHWMKDVLVSQGTLQQKIRLAERKFELSLEDAVAGSETLSPATRIEVYTTGYMLRLLECMEADLPALRAYLGEDLFVMFAKAYLLDQPSRSYSLFELSSGFADFLDRTRPRSQEMDAATNAAYDLPAELARVERGRLEAMRARGTEGAPASSIPDTFTFFSGKEVLLEAHPCLQLLRLKMPLADFYRKLLRNEKPDIPEARESFLAISRIRYTLQMVELEEWKFRLLQALQNSTTPQRMTDVLKAVAEPAGIALRQLLADASLWLVSAIACGFVLESQTADR